MPPSRRTPETWPSSILSIQRELASRAWSIAAALPQDRQSATTGAQVRTRLDTLDLECREGISDLVLNPALIHAVAPWALGATREPASIKCWAGCAKLSLDLILHGRLITAALGLPFQIFKETFSAGSLVGPKKSKLPVSLPTDLMYKYSARALRFSLIWKRDFQKGGIWDEAQIKSAEKHLAFCDCLVALRKDRTSLR